MGGLLGIGGEGGCPSSPGGRCRVPLDVVGCTGVICLCLLLPSFAVSVLRLCLPPFNLQRLVGAIGEGQDNDLSGLCCCVNPIIIQASPGALPGHWPHFIAIVSLLGANVVWIILFNGSGVLLGFVVAALFTVARLGVLEYGGVVCCSWLEENFSWSWGAQLFGPWAVTYLLCANLADFALPRFVSRWRGVLLLRGEAG